MTKINLVFDDIYDNADIIAVPNEIVFRIEEIGQEFLNWVPTADDSEYWKIVDGRKYTVAETDGFIKWLNTNYCFETKKAYVVARNTAYCPQYKTIEF